MTDKYPSDCELTQFLRERAESKKESADDLLKRAERIKLLLLDVDGILTDGSIPYTATGEEIKTFNSKDGFGLNILQKIGVQIGLITARKSEALMRRAKDLKIVHLHQGARNKVAKFKEIIAELDLSPAETAYMGDDWLDMPLLAEVGLAATVADAVPEVKDIVHYVTDNPGGRGGVREVCDLIIKSQGKREWLLNHVEEL
jgi:3-deoxy-D-manno-octulosonate 8-phosphate phosphatase (KDO 8-P phosphatase)